MRAMLLALLLALLLAFPAAAQDRIEVDLLLVLAVDVSRSMSPGELEIQRRGYAEALVSPDVIAAIHSGYLGRIGLTYVEWAGTDALRIVADWAVIEPPADARALAARIAASPPVTLRRTSISGALLFAWERLAQSPYDAPRRVVDISGDGPNNQGAPVLAARDLLVAEGITINGLPLMTREGAGGRWHLDDLDRYYQTCVIGGPGAFVVAVRDWSAFAEAVRRKLVLEISGLAALGLRLAQSAPANAIDCEIGEKIWQRGRDFDFQ